MADITYKFSGKYILKADLRCTTGLHIGGTDEGFEIGGIDNPVIKDPITGYPFIPGSSLKGKMRSLLEWTTKHKDKTKNNNTEQEVDRIRVQNMLREKEGKLTAQPCNCGECDVCIVFGVGASADTQGQKEPTRLTVRDSFPKGLFDHDGKMLDEDKRTDTIIKWHELGEKIYTEAKTENAIDRLTSAANPRTMERVPADSVFEVEMLFDIYKDDDKQKMKKIFEGIMLLEDSSLGGGGSRGSGRVVFENIKVFQRTIKYYTDDESQVEISLNGNKTAGDIHKNFGNIFK